jgi:hypothetical protein
MTRMHAGIRRDTDLCPRTPAAFGRSRESSCEPGTVIVIVVYTRTTKKPSAQVLYSKATRLITFLRRHEVSHTSGDLPNASGRVPFALAGKLHVHPGRVTLFVQGGWRGSRTLRRSAFGETRTLRNCHWADELFGHGRAIAAVTLGQSTDDARMRGN